MPDYSVQVDPHDRWAIAAYIRALQLSQTAPAAMAAGKTMTDVPATPATGGTRTSEHDGMERK